MTTEKMIEVMKAYTEGKAVQCKLLKYDFCIWMNDSNPCWDWKHYEYRIKQNLEE